MYLPIFVNFVFLLGSLSVVGFWEGSWLSTWCHDWATIGGLPLPSSSLHCIYDLMFHVILYCLGLSLETTALRICIFFSSVTLVNMCMTCIHAQHWGAGVPACIG